MKKIQLIAKIKSHKAHTPIGFPDNYMESGGGFSSAYDRGAMYGKYSKYVNTKVIDEWTTGGPSMATVQETKTTWNNKALLKASVEELADLLEAIENTRSFIGKYANMSILDFLTFIDLAEKHKEEQL
jgi:hypothetical protein